MPPFATSSRRRVCRGRRSQCRRTGRLPELRAHLYHALERRMAGERSIGRRGAGGAGPNIKSAASIHGFATTA